MKDYKVARRFASIPHLRTSRTDGDKIAPISIEEMAVKKAPKNCTVIVQEKLDGSNVSVINIDGAITPITRNGGIAISSGWTQHRLFAQWVYANIDRFEWLQPGDRLVGEWLALAHGTRYQIDNEPFVVFDMMNKSGRMIYHEFRDTIGDKFEIAHCIHEGGAISISDAMDKLGTHGYHGAIDEVEGAVWRLEVGGKFYSAVKYVKGHFVPGKYLGDVEVWNWLP